MRPKAFCQRCGHYHQANALKKEIHGDRMLCSNCYKIKNGERLGKKLAVLPKINGALNNLSQNNKSGVPVANSGYKRGMLIRGEDEVLRKKYGYDRYNSNGKPCSQLQRLRDALIFKTKNVKIPINKDLNKNFCGGLK